MRKKAKSRRKIRISQTTEILNMKAEIKGHKIYIIILL